MDGWMSVYGAGKGRGQVRCMVGCGLGLVSKRFWMVISKLG
jgi:hypothetical protein